LLDLVSITANIATSLLSYATVGLFCSNVRLCQLFSMPERSILLER